jgi:hypothetical protein
MKFSTEEHLSMAKLLRRQAALIIGPTREKTIAMSNTFLRLAAKAAKHRGEISILEFDFEGLFPDWAVIDSQIERLKPLNEGPSDLAETELQEDRHIQVRQLIKSAIESPTRQGLTDFLDFTTKFRRLAIWNARMAYIQRPGACVIASEFEWQTVGRYVSPDAVPILILWPFSPIRFVYELDDTEPRIDRGAINDPFAAKGQLPREVLPRLVSNLKEQRNFKIKIEGRRLGFSYAGSAAAQSVLAINPSSAGPFSNDGGIGLFVGENATSNALADKQGIPAFRIVVNDRLEPGERFVTIAHELGHIFCGHLGSCLSRSGREEESGWPDRRSLGKPEKEVEAEAVAYLVASRAGLVTKSAEYLQGYAQDADIKKIDVELIVRAAARIERLAKIHYGSMALRQ